MQTGRARAAGAGVAAVVVAAGAWWWAASGGEEPPQGVVSVGPVGDDAARTPGERPSVHPVRPEGERPDDERPDGERLDPPPPSSDGAAAHRGEPVDLADHTVGGYEGWWSSDGNGAACDAYADAHPEVVLASTRTGAVIEAHTRGVRLQRPPATPPGDPARWPADSVVVLEAGTGEVLESFAVDESGWRLETPVDCVPPSETP
ncbi:hypothetical protein [Cellulosimicrobium cellulans]|uniref:hypothetical protein n=1 Tax=Cellulosimicrobium cellulans TaxID=1710 RepID=UPI000300A879|nr:hypothetical protein [Cellulosimicrobium cellulans]